MNRKHIVFYSGGAASYAVARTLCKQYGEENVLLLFTDTMVEDYDLYRFLEESSYQLGAELIEISDGRDIWDVCFDARYLSNSRVAKCSHILKQQVAKEWIFKNYSPDTCYLYLGIDWTESHRCASPTKNWRPYAVRYPLCEPPYLSKEDVFSIIRRDGLRIPRLYSLGFAHNNCGGFCFRAGMGHFRRLLDKMPERYMYHEQKEEALRQYIGKDVTILRRQKNNVRYRMSLKQFREDYIMTNEDHFDIGGCGCFVE